MLFDKGRNSQTDCTVGRGIAYTYSRVTPWTPRPPSVGESQALDVSPAQYLKDFAHVPGARICAIASRSAARADAFADLVTQSLSCPRRDAHNSYVDMITNPTVDVVYVATPHPQHRPIALAAIDAGKAVLVEKSFAATAHAAAEIAEAARAKKIFAMEGMWTRFLPVATEMIDAVNNGAIGEPTGIQGDLFALRDYDPDDRLFSPALGGGVTLDLGVYALDFAIRLFGEPTEVIARGDHFPNGVDSDASMLLTFPKNKFATLAISFTSDGAGRMTIQGTNGWIEVEPRFHHPSRILIHRRKVIPEGHNTPRAEPRLRSRAHGGLRMPASRTHREPDDATRRHAGSGRGDISGPRPARCGELRRH